MSKKTFVGWVIVFTLTFAGLAIYAFQNAIGNRPALEVDLVISIWCLILIIACTNVSVRMIGRIKPDQNSGQRLSDSEDPMDRRSDEKQRRRR